MLFVSHHTLSGITRRTESRSFFPCRWRGNLGAEDVGGVGKMSGAVESDPV